MKRTILLGALACAALASAPAPAQAPALEVAFESDLPSSYRVAHVRVVVDGAVRWDGPAPARPLWFGAGHHVVAVTADYRLHDAALPYVDKYALELQSTRVVDAPASSPLVLVAAAVPNGDATTPVEKSARIVWRTRSLR
jgi:hypothetical protein